MNRRLPVLALVALMVTSVTCYPVRRMQTLPQHELARRRIETPTKVHLHDGSVILLQSGFYSGADTLFGFGDRHWIGAGAPLSRPWRIPLDSVTGLEYFEEKVPGARAAASVPLVTLTTLGIAVPLLKAIFGSCPTIYTHDGSRYRLEAECFSYSIGSSYEAPDLDRLEQRTPTSGRFTLRMRNEALETHYVDAFSMAYVDHPQGTEAFPTDDGEVLLVDDPRPAVRVRSSQGRDITSLVRYRDNLPYTIDTARIAALFARGARDWIELTVPVAPDAEEITLALRGRNSLENTILLYDVMMRDQGLSVLDWSESLDGNLLYAWQLYRWYSTMSGIDIEVETDGAFERVARITDTGPIAWKSVAARIRLPEHGDSVRIRLSFIPDGWHIDWVGFDAGLREQPELHRIACADARGNVPSIASVVPAIADDDGEYLVTYPGEWLDLAFVLPPAGAASRTLFIDARGYYVEWVRPEWIRERPVVHGFDLDRPEAISTRLAERWIDEKATFEKEFYDFRIPTADPERPW